MHNKDIGFEGDQVIIVPLQTDPMTENFRNYKGIFTKNANVLNVSRASYFPGDNANQNMFALEGSEEQLPLWNMEVDYDFFETLGVQLAEGREFNRELDNDSIPSYILNETAVKNLNIENAIGKRIANNFRPNGEEINYGTIIGIVKDFHIEGFNQEIRPMILSVSNQVWFASFKIANADMTETIAYIEEEWNKLEPSHPFRYTFLDQKFGALLRQQENFGTMFLFLTILAIIISATPLSEVSSL